MAKKITQSFLRDEIGNYMTILGKRNPKVIVINADLSGTCRNREFGKRFPERQFNVGIAEQNAVSFAAGLAHEGFIPYIFSMAPFITMRACEQCRSDVAYANLPVRLIGVYAGVSGGISGATHWALEDCGIMTAICGMTVLEPCDAHQATQMLDLSLDFSKPLYIRSSVEPVRYIYPKNIPVQIGGSIEIIPGSDAAILCSGVTVQFAIDAAMQLKASNNLSVRVVDMYSIKPIDRKAVISAAHTGNVLVVQDHNIIGGLGSMVATTIAEENLNTNFKVLGVTDQFVPMAHANYLYQMFEMDTNGLKKNMLELVNKM